MRHSPLPTNMPLEDTLARRVVQLREFRNLTVKDLAQMTRFKLNRLEELESGMETWLSIPDRQVLAKALGVEPGLLAEVERRPVLDDSEFRKVEDDIARQILAGGRDLPCPRCGHILKCRTEQAFDIEGNPFHIAKAFCLKCPFVVR